MQKLADIYEKFMPEFMKNKLIETHSEYFLSILREYDENVSNLFCYGTITYRERFILVGTEFEFATIDMEYPATAKDFFNILIYEKEKYLSLEDLYKKANATDSNNIYIPVYVDNQMIFCVCSKEKDKILSYFEISDGIELYEKYPLLIGILSWGISYIIPKDGPERIFDNIVAETEKFAKYIREKAAIVDLVFGKMKLPYISTIHSIASWNYEGKANYGYIDFENPFSNNSKEHLSIVFKDRLLFNGYKARTIRKYVELSDEKLRLKATSSYSYISGVNDDEYWSIIGLGEIEKDVYASIRFEGRNRWRLFLNNEIIIYDGFTFIFGTNRVKEPNYKKLTKLFYKELSWITDQYDEDAVKRVNCLIELASNQKHGTMIIFSDRAAGEAERLCKSGRGIRIEPLNFDSLLKTNINLAKRIMDNVSKIDGAIIFDIEGICYSIGTIVDGRACDNSNPGRGARYNSAYTYVNDCNERGILCYCAVISEDETVDVFGLFGKEITEKINSMIKEGKRKIMN